MKALVLKEYMDLRYEDVPLPVLMHDEVLIKVMACAICGSDVHGMDGSTGRRIPPVIMGHEASGVIEKTGSSVTGFKQGDRVTFDSTIYCGRCDYCRTGDVNLCDNRMVLGVSCDDYRKSGAFAQYITVPERILYKLPDNVSFIEATMIEPLAIAYHALNRTCVRVTDTTAVIGAGMIGSFVIKLLKLSGVKKIISIDTADDKLAGAERSGADICINPSNTDLLTKIMEQTDNKGCDIVYEAVGVDKAFLSAVSILRKGGRLVMIGNLQKQVGFPLQTAVTKQLEFFGSCASTGEYPGCIDLISSGRISVDEFISAAVPLIEGPELFKRLYDKEDGLMKVILIP